MVTIENRDGLASTPARGVALACVEAGIEAALPERVVEDSLSPRDGALVVRDADGDETEHDLDAYERVIVLGGGKGAGDFARALETALGDRVDGGVVVTTDPAGTERIDEFEGDHPLPTPRNERGAREVLAAAEAAGEDDLVLAAITGGGSALLAAPAEGISLEELRRVTDDLLDSGASIDEINAVRKHCSAIKGGRLARAAAPATVLGLLVSDVVGDDPATIASGPVVPDPTTYGDAIGVLERYGIDAPDAVRERLSAGADGDLSETPIAGDPVFDRSVVRILANARTAIDAAAEAAADRGYDPLVLSSRVRGEARESALTHAAIAEECAATGQPIEPPAVLLSGGEVTVTVRGDGSGGPNQEFALAATAALDVPDAVVAAADTDGIDGSTDAAGAIADPGTVDAAAARGALDRNDAYPLLDRAGALLRTGYTGTNVNDLRVLVVEEE